MKTQDREFADRGQTVAETQLDIENVNTDEYAYGGKYTYNSTASPYPTYTIPFYTRYTVEFAGGGATGGSTESQDDFVWGTAQNLNKNGFTRSHTVTYSGNGGTPAIESDSAAASFSHWTGEDGQTFTDGQSVNKLTGVSRDTYTMTANWNYGSVTLPEATREGYTLEGWYNGSTKVGNAGDSYPLSSDVTLTANWTANTYKVTLDNQGATTAGTAAYWYKYKTTSTVNGETIYYWTNEACTTPLYSYKITVPTKEGYTFGGYWTGTNGGGTQYVNAEGYCINNLYNAVAANTTLYANWTANTYTVRYEGNGATSGSTASQTFSWGESKALSANGFKKEFAVTYNANGGTASKTSETAASTFNGWEDRNDIIYNGVTYLWTTFDAPYYANRYTDLYKAFDYDKYSLVGHYVNHGMKEGRDPIDPNGERSYYKETYTYDVDGTATTVTTVAANLTTENNGEVVLIANWTPKNVNLPTASRTGYTFNGWLGSDGTTYEANAVVPITSNITFTAQWSAVSYTIGYNLNGGSVSPANPTSYTVESNAITLNNPTKTGYTFTGWTGTDLSSASTSVTIAKGSTGNRSYTANWSVETYEITYDYNGGTDPGNPTSFTVESGEITLKNPTKTGYIFDGWTGANGSTPQKDVTISANSTGEKTYTANWTAESYTITYDLAGGNDPGNPTSYTIESADISLKAPTRTGYVFTGWTGSNGMTAQTSVTIPTGSTGNKSYTATWVESEYTIKWVNHDGALLYEADVKYNVTPTYGGEAPTRDSTAEHDFTFSGWSPEIAPATEDATYTAQYTSTVRKYEITFRNEDGTVLETKEFEYNTTPTYTGATPTKEPTESEVFTFAGWSPELGTVTGEAEYTATYTSAPRKYIVTWKNGETVLATEEYEYNATPTYKGEEPTKDKDKTYRYEFAGWDPAISNVITDVTYSAVFTSIELPPVADLTIVTTDCDEAQSFVFSVESIEDAAFAPIEVSIVGNGKAVIKDVPAGQYKVSEETEWTWRYDDVAAETVDVSAGDANTATFEGIKVPAIVKWLSGLASLFK